MAVVGSNFLQSNFSAWDNDFERKNNLTGLIYKNIATS